MSKTFFDKNTIKFSHKGPVGRARRNRASRFYENTFSQFSNRDYGKDFEYDKLASGMSVFATFLGDKTLQNRFLRNLPQNSAQYEKTGLSMGQALGLRNMGWTLDRLIMRTRDQDYAILRYTPDHIWGDRFDMPIAEKRLTPRDVAMFVRADRIATEPSLISAFRTKEELSKMGYTLANNASPDMTIDGTDFYDLSNCTLLKRKNKKELFVGYDLDNIHLNVVEQGKFDAFAKLLSSKLHISITRDDSQPEPVKFVGYQGVFGRIAHKVRSVLRRINTSVREPILDCDKFVYNGTKLTTSSVADLIKKISNSISVEAYDEFEKISARKRVGNAYQQNLAIGEITSNMLADCMCRMGIFCDHDSKVLAKYFRTNTARSILDLQNCDDPDCLSTIAEVYSICSRRLANALDVDFEVFARQSNIPFDPKSDKIFDDLLCKRAPITINNYLSRRSPKRCNVAQKQKTVDKQKDMLKPNGDDKASLHQSAQTQQKQQQTDKNKDLSSQQPSVQQIVRQMLTKRAPLMLPEGKIKVDAQKQNNIKSNKLQNNTALKLETKLATSYTETDDYGFKATNLEQGQTLLAENKLSKSLMRSISETILLPSLKQIMDEYDDDYFTKTQDDICAVVRKYKKIMQLNNLEKEEREEKIWELSRKLDALVRVGQPGKEKLVSVTKAFNLYKLTQDIAKDVVVYKNATPDLSQTNSLKQVFKSYIVEHQDLKLVRGEIKELVKDEILDLNKKPEKTNN